MGKIIDLYREFMETKSKFDERYKSNYERIQSLNAELRELKAKYDDRIYQEETGGDVFTAKEQAAIKNRIRDIADEIEELEKRNNFNRKGRTQALIEIVPAMKARAEARRAELVKEHADQAEKVRRNLAEYLLSLKELGDIEEDIKKANAEFFEKVSKEAGTNDRLPDVEKVKLYEHNPVFSSRSGTFGGEPKAGIYGVLPYEIDNAYDGKLPEWVNDYRK